MQTYISLNNRAQTGLHDSITTPSVSPPACFQTCVLLYATSGISVPLVFFPS